METRNLRCASCKGYSNVKGTFNGNETYKCVSCGALNQISSKSGKMRYKIASLLTILVGLFIIFSDKSGWNEYGQYDSLTEYILTGMILPGIILCAITYFGTLIVAKIIDWLFG
jgi:phage FluMu protein Com